MEFLCDCQKTVTRMQRKALTFLVGLAIKQVRLFFLRCFPKFTILVMCLTLATYLPYLLLPTERKVLTREHYTENTLHTVIHTHTNLRVSSLCKDMHGGNLKQPAWPKLGTQMVLTLATLSL